MNPRYFDLRFLIGIYFGLTGFVLVLASLGGHSVPDGDRINLYSGLGFITFAGLMLLSFRAGNRAD